MKSCHRLKILGCFLLRDITITSPHNGHIRQVRSGFELSVRRFVPVINPKNKSQQARRSTARSIQQYISIRHMLYRYPKFNKVPFPLHRHHRAKNRQTLDDSPQCLSHQGIIYHSTQFDELYRMAPSTAVETITSVNQVLQKPYWGLWSPGRNDDTPRIVRNQRILHHSTHLRERYRMVQALDMTSPFS